MLLFVIAEADVVAGLGEGIPGDVEPGGGGQELVGEVVVAEEVDQALELSRVFGTNVGGLAEKVLGIANAPYPTIDSLATEARINDDGSYFEAGWLQQHQAAIGQIRYRLHRGDVLRIFLQIQKLAQLKVLGKLYFIEILFHGILEICVTCS